MMKPVLALFAVLVLCLPVSAQETDAELSARLDRNLTALQAWSEAGLRLTAESTRRDAAVWEAWVKQDEYLWSAEGRKLPNRRQLIRDNKALREERLLANAKWWLPAVQKYLASGPSWELEPLYIEPKR